MTQRSDNPLCVSRKASAIPLALALAVSLVFLSLSIPAWAESPGPPVQTTARGANDVGVRAYLRLPATYTILRGTEFDGRSVHTFDAVRTAYLPKISGGFGVKPSIGVAFDHVLPWFGIMTGVSFGYSKHQAISYNVGNSWYEHPDAKLYQVELEFRALLELWDFKPFVGISPGFTFLSLPHGITQIGVDHIVSWSDLTLRGFSMEEQVGMLYQVVPALALDATMGFRLQRLTSSSAGTLSIFGFSPGWSASLGVVAKY